MLGGALAAQTVPGGIAGTNELLPTYARPTFRAISEVASGTAADAVITKPAGTVEGDIMIAWINKEATASFGMPSGWSAASEFNTIGGSRVVYAWKRATASEGASYTFDMDNTGPGTTWRSGFIISYYNCVATGDPNSVTPSADAPSGTTNELPHSTITPAHVGSLLVGLSSWLNGSGVPARSLAAAYMPSRHGGTVADEVAGGERIHQGSYPIPATGALPWILLGTAEARRSGVLAALKPALLQNPALIVCAAVAGAATVGNLTVSSPASSVLTLQPVTGAAVVSNLVVASPANLTLGAVTGGAVVGNVALATPANLSLGAVVAGATVQNVGLITRPFLSLTAPVGGATVAPLLVSSPAILALGAVTGGATVSNVVVTTPSTGDLVLAAVVGAAVVGNVTLVTRPILSLGAAAGGATVSNVNLVTQPYLALGAVVGAAVVGNVGLITGAVLALSSPAGSATVGNVVISTDAGALILQPVSGGASVANVTLTTRPILALSAPAGIAIVSGVTLVTRPILALSAAAGLAGVANVGLITRPFITPGPVAGLAVVSNIVITNGAALIISIVNLGASYAPAVLGSASYTPVVALEAVQE